jgi:aldose sugar dehydrogenase
MRLVVIVLIAIMLAAPVYYASAQEVHEHAEHAAESSGPSIVDEDLQVEQVEDGIVLPTAMAFLDEDTMIVLEKDNGTVRMVRDGELQEEPMLDVAVANDNERGMLGVAVSRENVSTTYVFLYFTESGGGSDGDDLSGVAPAGNRLYRYELQDDQLVNPKLLLDLPALPGPRYNGGPVLVGPDDFVYVIIGDVEGHATQAQNFEDGPAADGTSGVLRVGKNGEVPPSIIGTGAFGKYYYAYGVRNSFGIDFDPVTGALWDTENGPATGDEINLVDAGFNSGWRDVQGMAAQGDLGDLVLFNARSHYSDPEFVWTEPIGPTALKFLDSDRLGSQYENDIFVGDINNGALYRFDLNSNRTALSLSGNLADRVADTPSENQAITFGTGFGGITDIKVGPDGYLYVLSFIDGAIFRIVPETATEQPEEAVDLAITSANTEGDTITGMYTVVESSNGTMLQEGFTPLTFTGEAGSTYTVTVADFGNREFERWDNGDTGMTRTITLEEDTTITAIYEIIADEEEDSDEVPGINAIIRLLDIDGCFDDADERKLGKSIGKIVEDIFGEDEAATEKLDRTLDKIMADCFEGEDQGDDDGGNRGRGNDDNNGRGRGGGNED